MPKAYCRKCGSLTNTAVANVDWRAIGGSNDTILADGCYLRWDMETKCYVKGCQYDDLLPDSLERRLADRILKKD